MPWRVAGVRSLLGSAVSSVAASDRLVQTHSSHSQRNFPPARLPLGKTPQKLATYLYNTRHWKRLENYRQQGRQVVSLLKYKQSFKCDREAMFRVRVGDRVVNSNAVDCEAPTEFVVPSDSTVELQLEFEDGSGQTMEFKSGERVVPCGLFGETSLVSRTEVEL